MSDKDKKAPREAGEDPEALLQKINSERVDDNKKRARWEELTRTEEELAVYVESLEGGVPR